MGSWEVWRKHLKNRSELQQFCVLQTMQKLNTSFSTMWIQAPILRCIVFHRKHPHQWTWGQSLARLWLVHWKSSDSLRLKTHTSTQVKSNMHPVPQTRQTWTNYFKGHRGFEAPVCIKKDALPCLHPQTNAQTYISVCLLIFSQWWGTQVLEGVCRTAALCACVYIQ